MAFPYQCLVARREASSASSAWTLFGASASKIVVQSSNGATSTWSPPSGPAIGPQDDEQERPGKRIKLATPKEPKLNFSTLILSNDGQHLIGVTGEDKCIRVFHIDAQSRLQQLSERCMSRKPSSITLTADDSTILVADKFGDVYALPLLPSPDDVQEVVPAPVRAQPEEKDFTPSASVLTVHSGRNRRTLEEQLKQKAKGPLKTKEVMTFRHDLLLGHVSMLTDLAVAKVDNKSYIITADRDEHIRVSRGVPQAHIIEGFCFGHEEFVSRLCVTRSGLLVSGGGDTHLYVWNWQNYRLGEKLPLRETALQHLKSRPEVSALPTDDASFKVAVSGIWEVPGSNSDVEVLVACEGSPALFTFKLGTGTAGSSIPLAGNALDVAFVSTSAGAPAAIVSIDNVHEPGSTSKVREDKDASRLQYFSKQADGGWHEDPNMEEALGPFAIQGSTLDVDHGDGAGLASADDKAVRDILYHVENLRKRPGAED